MQKLNTRLKGGLQKMRLGSILTFRFNSFLFYMLKIYLCWKVESSSKFIEFTKIWLMQGIVEQSRSTEKLRKTVNWLKISSSTKSEWTFSKEKVSTKIFFQFQWFVCRGNIRGCSALWYWNINSFCLCSNYAGEIQLCSNKGKYY